MHGIVTSAVLAFWGLVVSITLGHSPRLLRRAALGGSPVVPVGAVGAHAWLVAAALVLLTVTALRLTRSLA